MIVPSNEAELAEAVVAAVSVQSPLEICGGRTRLGLGRPVQAEKTVSVAGLSGISLYEPGALTLVAKAGTPVAQIEEALAAEGQMLAFEPIDHRALLGTDGTPTIGGAVAVAASGPRRIQRGACRDFMLGVRLVDGQGQVITNGGRVMKNVTGIDLVKLMAGAHGTLGVLSEVSFKVLPRPEATAVLSLPGLDDVTAVRAMAEAMGSPFDVSGAVHLKGVAPGEASTLIRVEGLEGSVAYRAGRLRDHLSGFGEIEIDTDADRISTQWRQIRDVEVFADTQGAIWRLSVKPSDAPGIVAALKESFDLNVMYDWAGGLVWLRVPDNGDAAAAAIRAEVGRSGGHATLIRASAATRAGVDVFQLEPAPLAQTSAGLRAKFDPKGILNPGRMRA